MKNARVWDVRVQTKFTVSDGKIDATFWCVGTLDQARSKAKRLARQMFGRRRFLITSVKLAGTIDA